MKTFLIGLVVLLFAIPTVAAPSPLGTSWQGGGQHSGWIEQQQITPTTPNNPFGGSCHWSVNDHELLTTTGYLEPGQTVTHSKCVVSDYANVAPFGFSTAQLVSKSPDLTLTVCFSPQGRCFSGSPVRESDRLYHSTVCVRAHYLESDPLMQEIPESFGGRGLVTTVTTSYTNPTSRRASAIARSGFASDIAVFLGWVDAVGCLPDFPYVDHFDYPFEWTTS